MTDADQSKADEARLEEVEAKLRAAHEAVDAEYRLVRGEDWAAWAKREAVRSASAARQRERRKAGRLVLKAEVVEDQFAEALILSARLTEAEAADRKLLDRALGDIARDFIARWLPSRIKSRTSSQ